MADILAVCIPLFALSIGMVAVVSKTIVRPVIDAYLTTHPVVHRDQQIALLEARIEQLEQQLLPADGHQRAA